MEATKDIDGQQVHNGNILYQWNIPCHISELAYGCYYAYWPQDCDYDVLVTLCMISSRNFCAVGAEKAKRKKDKENHIDHYNGKK